MRSATLPVLICLSLVPALLGSSRTAFAQAQARPGGPIRQETSGRVSRYVVGPAGNVRGVQLDNGILVMLPGVSGNTMAHDVPIGQTVGVQGFAMPGNDRVLHRATIHGPDGRVVAAPMAMPAGQAGRMDPGPGMGPGMGQGPCRGAAVGGGPCSGMGMGMMNNVQLQPFNASGPIQTLITGPSGEIHALLLTDGTSVFLSAPLAVTVQRQGGLRVGAVVRASGQGGSYPLGASVLADQIVLPNGTIYSAPPGSPAASP